MWEELEYRGEGTGETEKAQARFLSKFPPPQRDYSRLLANLH
jgi:hypothetical protein